MELSREHIGKRAILIKTQNNLLKDSEVVIRSVSDKYPAFYAVEIIKESSEWEYSDTSHNCDGFFDKNIGYFVRNDKLELIQEIVNETIEDNFEIPSGL